MIILNISVEESIIVEDKFGAFSKKVKKIASYINEIFNTLLTELLILLAVLIPRAPPCVVSVLRKESIT